MGAQAGTQALETKTQGPVAPFHSAISLTCLVTAEQQGCE